MSYSRAAEGAVDRPTTERDAVLMKMMKEMANSLTTSMTSTMGSLSDKFAETQKTTEKMSVQLGVVSEQQSNMKEEQAKILEKTEEQQKMLARLQAENEDNRTRLQQMEAKFAALTPAQGGSSTTPGQQQAAGGMKRVAEGPAESPAKGDRSNRGQRGWENKRDGS
jgi:septal ring factor EnvC (AmiA/AmiB activator)